MPHLERVQPVDNQQIFTLSLKWCRNLISKTNISTMPHPFVPLTHPTNEWQVAAARAIARASFHHSASNRASSC